MNMLGKKGKSPAVAPLVVGKPRGTEGCRSSVKTSEGAAQGEGSERRASNIRAGEVPKSLKTSSIEERKGGQNLPGADEKKGTKTRKSQFRGRETIVTKREVSTKKRGPKNQSTDIGGVKMGLMKVGSCGGYGNQSGARTAGA